MRNAACQATQRIHLLGLAKLFLEFFALSNIKQYPIKDQAMIRCDVRSDTLDPNDLSWLFNKRPSYCQLAPVDMAGRSSYKRGLIFRVKHGYQLTVKRADVKVKIK
ncbi:MAG: hypothetical protein R2867_08690 [Caldilineaceae bacterium]